MSGEQWPMYVWAIAVALAVLAAVWTASNRRGVRPVLPFEHVAGAALVGVFGWEMLVHLPGAVMGYWSLTAGLGDVRGIEGHQAFVMAQAVFAAGAGVAIAGILRRRTWGAVLGVGLASARALWSGLLLYQTTIMFGGVMGDAAYLDMVAAVIGLQATPALAAIGLLVWPFMRRATARVETSGGDDPSAA